MNQHLNKSDGERRAFERQPGAPLWTQVKSDILKMIVTGVFLPGDRLPSEAELCERYGVSRPVVREALSQLVFEQQVFKHQGKGAFVSAQRDDEDFIGTTVGFSDELLAKNRLVTRKILRQTVADPSPEARRLLRLDLGQKVVQVDRVLSVNGTPRMLVRISLRGDAVPGLDKQPLENRSLYETMRRAYGLTFRRAERWIEAVQPTAEEAGWLEIAVSTPVLKIESVSYASTHSSDPVEYFQAIHRTDRGRLHFVIR